MSRRRPLTHLLEPFGSPGHTGAPGGPQDWRAYQSRLCFPEHSSLSQHLFASLYTDYFFLWEALCLCCCLQITFYFSTFNHHLFTSQISIDWLISGCQAMARSSGVFKSSLAFTPPLDLIWGGWDLFNIIFIPSATSLIQAEIGSRLQRGPGAPHSCLLLIIKF